MILAWRAISCAGMSTRAMPPCCKVRAEMALLGKRCAAPAAAGRLAATKVYTDVQSLFFFFFLWKKAYMSIDANYISNPRDR